MKKRRNRHGETMLALLGFTTISMIIIVLLLKNVTVPAKICIHQRVHGDNPDSSADRYIYSKKKWGIVSRRTELHSTAALFIQYCFRNRMTDVEI